MATKLDPATLANQYADQASLPLSNLIDRHALLHILQIAWLDGYIQAKSETLEDMK